MRWFHFLSYSQEERNFPKSDSQATVNIVTWNLSFLFNLIPLFQPLGWDYNDRYSSRMRGERFSSKFQNDNTHKTSPVLIMQKSSV